MSDTFETDSLREAIDNGAATEAEMTSLAGKLERERDEARAKLECLLMDSEQGEPQPLRAGEPSDFEGAIRRMRDAERERDEARAERDEWIARFRADEELIKEAMQK